MAPYSNALLGRAVSAVTSIHYIYDMVTICGLTLRELVASLESKRQKDENIWLRETLSLPQALPRADGFAAADDFLALLVRVIRALARDQQPPSILELGSGISTLVIAQTLAQLGIGPLRSLEHEARFAARTRRWLAKQNLSDSCEVLHAPLQPCPPETGTSNWYDRSVLPAEAQFDLLVIDGPPAWFFSPMARAPALPMLADQLAPRALILLDDYQRRGEHHCVANWQAQFPHLQVAEIATRKGTAILRWDPPA